MKITILKKGARPSGDISIRYSSGNVEKSKNKITLRKLNQEKGTLDQDIRKLERRLITEERLLKRKKFMPGQHVNRSTD